MNTRTTFAEVVPYRTSRIPLNMHVPPSCAHSVHSFGAETSVDVAAVEGLVAESSAAPEPPPHAVAAIAIARAADPALTSRMLCLSTLNSLPQVKVSPRE